MTRSQEKARQRAADKAKRLDWLAANHLIAFNRVCPTCGTKLYRNLSLMGWWQCGHLGAKGFQREEGPNCDFQMFYDPTPEEHSEILLRFNADQKTKGLL